MKINFSNTAAEILALLFFLTDEELNNITEVSYNGAYDSQLEIQTIEKFIFKNLGKFGTENVMDFNLSQIKYCLNGTRKFRFLREIFDNSLCDNFPVFRVPFFYVCPSVLDKHLSQEECLTIVKFLEDRKSYGVVVNYPEFPDSEWVMKISANFVESVEILKQSKLGYIGLVSAMAVLASKKFDSNSLYIKAPQLLEGPWSEFFFAPHNTSKFIYSDLLKLT